MEALGTQTSMAGIVLGGQQGEDEHGLCTRNGLDTALDSPLSSLGT